MNTNEIILSQIEDRFKPLTEYPHKSKSEAMSFIVSRNKPEILAQDILWLIKQVRMYQDSE